MLEKHKDYSSPFSRSVKKQNGKPAAVCLVALEHRVVWYEEHGWVPSKESGYSIDHINRDPTDNRIENLRIADQYQQKLNRGPTGASRFYGVWFDITGGFYASRIMLRGRKRKTFARFDCEADAAKARDLGALFYLSEEDTKFLPLNFPDLLPHYKNVLSETVDFVAKQALKELMNLV